MTRFLDSPELQGPKPGLDPSVRQRLIRHLETTAAEISLDFADSRVEPLKPIDPETERRLEQLEEFLIDDEARPDSSTAPGDENNNSRKRKKKGRAADSSTTTTSPGTSNPGPLVQVRIY